mmetsp:Transcript_1047/g.1908  ORF Transcript_1047/g.1908 Transcript_1047/m.1908 type:complete len:80 (-) Transcript_1047:228-467(-)
MHAQQPFVARLDRRATSLLIKPSPFQTSWILMMIVGLLESAWKCEQGCLVADQFYASNKGWLLWKTGSYMTGAFRHQTA